MKKLFVLGLAALSLTTFAADKSETRVTGGLQGTYYGVAGYVEPEVSVHQLFNHKINEKLDVDYGPGATLGVGTFVGVPNYTIVSVDALFNFRSELNYKVSNTTKLYAGAEAGLGLGVGYTHNKVVAGNSSSDVKEVNVSFGANGKLVSGVKYNKFNAGVFFKGAYSGAYSALSFLPNAGIELGYSF